MSAKKEEGSSIWEQVRERLREKGIDLDALCGGMFDPEHFKMVCVAPDLKETVREMGKATRDQVVMVRVDEETMKSLDAWVETGAVKSRSEAAAVFIREGLKVRAPELERLGDALRDVEEAKQRLRDKVQELFTAES